MIARLALRQLMKRRLDGERSRMLSGNTLQLERNAVVIRPRRCLAALLVVGRVSSGALGPGGGTEAQVVPMNRMDHGPFVSSTITLDPLSPRGVIVHKGIAVKVDREATVVFDTDLLRVVAAWTGGMLHWRPARDSLQEWPTPDGHLHFLNPEKAGWSTNADLTDPRGGPATLNNARRYGPLPGNRRYEGLHVHGDDVVFSLTIGDATIRETFGFQRIGSDPVFTRTINVSPTAQKLTLLVVSAPVGQATRLEQTVASADAGHVAIHSGGEVRLIGYRGLPKDMQWNLEDGQLSLSLPPLSDELRFQLAIGPVRPVTGPTSLTRMVQTDAGLLDLAPLLEPGPARYQTLETQAQTATSEHGPWVVDTFVLPHENPWQSHLRLSAVDFLSDGRAVVASLSGDVWLVSGIQDALGTLRWQRFATGLNQPLGLVVVNDTIYVNGRDQITRLHDTNKDGYADHYENFNNAVMTGTNFHAFNLNLEVDAQGRFLWAKSTPWPTGNPGELSDAHQIPPHDGVLFRLSPDGRQLEIIARGLRNPNGLSIGPKGEIYVSDNEGNWVPTSKVTRIDEGAFHGFVPSAHRASLVGGWAPADDWVKPLVWTPHAGPGSDNSPSQARVIDNPAWPKELQGDLLLASYGRGTLSLLLMEEVDGQPQAAHMILPLQFRSGLQQMRFHRDGHLYLVGMTNWSSTSYGGERGGFHRVRYNAGKPLHLPVALHTRPGGLEFRFAEPLDRASATNAANYRLSKWTYTWNSSYGSKQFFSVDKPGQAGPDPVAVQSAALSADGRTLLLEIPSLTPGSIPRIPITGTLPHQIEASIGMIMQIDYDIRAADGAQLQHLISKTIHRVPGDPHTTSHGKTTTTTSTPAPAEARTSGAPSYADPGVTKREPRATTDPGRVVVVRSQGLELGYEPALINARAGETLTIRYENVGEMTHNIVVVRSDQDVPIIGEAAFQAAFTNNWIPAGAEYAARMIAHTPLAGPKETVEVTFTVPPPGEYPFICTYASHWTVMRGRLIVDGRSGRLR
jgi:glucose/arabinose dehydrogenase/plastocyanin